MIPTPRNIPRNIPRSISRGGRVAGMRTGAAGVLKGALTGAMLALPVAAMTLAPALIPAPAVARAAPESFADLAEELSPAVVNISTAQTVDDAERGRRQLPPGSPFNDLFRDFFDRNRPQGPREVESLGSGFVISPEGFVVTNNHVIEDADEITVNFPDGTSLPAELVGTDPKTDIALLKLEPEGPLPFVQFGDSRVSRVGDWVLAIGNPFGLGGSVSAGIISARNRDINAGPYDDFIQTDAAINRGNSGGPLFNMDGDVIGVNTAIISPTGGSIGIGFAVPAAIAASVVDQLREFGTTRRGWLGVRIQTVNDELADALGLDQAAGALVAAVTEGGPAEDGGIQAGDVILRFNGEEVEAMRDLPRIVADTAVGSEVRVVVFREGQTQTVRVTLGLLEENEQPVLASAVQPEAQIEPMEMADLGLTLAPLTDETRQQFEIDGDGPGVLITDVTDGGAAAEEGLAAGQVIVEVGQQPVNSPNDVEEAVNTAREAGKKTILLLVEADGEPRFVPLGIGG
ncbi:MAG: DegQ family serine endoprotease [Pseudomonadota bacterium]